MLVKSVTDLIGKTPLLEIDPAVHGLRNINLYAKLELLNPFGSIKDRSAWGVLKDHLAELQSTGKTVIESSSGNMAKALQILCSMHNIRFRIVTNRIHVKEVRQVLQLVGAEIDEFPGLSACPDPSDPNDPLAYIERVMNGAPGQYHHTSQFTNEKNRDAHYTTTGPEIAADLGKVDFFLAGLGTSGSSAGVGGYLKLSNPQLKVIGIVAPRGQILPGIRSADELFEVGLFHKDFYDQIIEVTTGEAIDSLLVLNRKLGVLSGVTGGAGYAAALKYLSKIDATLTGKHNAVFLVCDRVEWYLSYLQKHRPEIFALPQKKDTVHAVTMQEADVARQLSLAEAQEWLQDPRALVVDLRGALAFKAGHIAGSINMPADMLEDLSQWGMPFSSHRRVLFLCPVGDQSKKFAAFFATRGIECASLSGGFIAWRDSGQPIERWMDHKTKPAV